jgi:hypothetical protein
MPLSNLPKRLSYLKQDLGIPLNQILENSEQLIFSLTREVRSPLIHHLEMMVGAARQLQTHLRALYESQSASDMEFHQWVTGQPVQQLLSTLVDHSLYIRHLYPLDSHPNLKNLDISVQRLQLRINDLINACC